MQTMNLKYWWLALGATAGFAFATSLLTGCGSGSSEKKSNGESQPAALNPEQQSGAETNQGYFGQRGPELIDQVSKGHAQGQESFSNAGNSLYIEKNVQLSPRRNNRAFPGQLSHLIVEFGLLETDTLICALSARTPNAIPAPACADLAQVAVTTEEGAVDPFPCQQLIALGMNERNIGIEMSKYRKDIRKSNKRIKAAEALIKNEAEGKSAKVPAKMQPYVDFVKNLDATEAHYKSALEATTELSSYAGCIVTE